MTFYQNTEFDTIYLLCLKLNFYEEKKYYVMSR